jgi:hypothetical protein
MYYLINTQINIFIYTESINFNAVSLGWVRLGYVTLGCVQLGFVSVGIICLPTCVFISMFNGKPEIFVYRAFIANTEIIILLLFTIVPF